MTNNHLMSVFNGRRSNAIHAIASLKMEKWFFFPLNDKRSCFLGKPFDFQVALFLWSTYIHNSRHLYLFQYFKKMSIHALHPQNHPALTFTFFPSNKKMLQVSFFVEITGRIRT